MKTLTERREYLKQLHPVWKKLTIYQKLKEAALLYPQVPLYEDENSSLSYQSILEEVDKIASSLCYLGIRKGDCIAVNLSNVIEYVYLTFAIASVGAVKVAVNRKSSSEQKKYMIEKTDSVLYITDKSEDISFVEDCVSLQGMILLYKKVQKNDKIAEWNDFLNQTASVRIVYHTEKRNDTSELAADNISDIIFTSGSSGFPKGVMLTHNMILRSAFANCLNRGFSEERKVLLTVPLYHVYGYIEGLLSVLFTGGTIVCTHGRFQVEKILSMIQDKQINDILCIPYTMQKIISNGQYENYDLSSLYAAYCSASTCPVWVWDAMREKLNISEIVTGYGMSEVSGATVQTDLESPKDMINISVGKVLRDNNSEDLLIEYKVVDSMTHKELPTGECGELVCRGSIVAKGYYNDREATEKAFTEDGWLYTGDKGSIDREGNVFFYGRLNDSYKINGENVSPLAVDQIIAECSEVTMVETVGIPDIEHGYTGVAFIQPESYNLTIKEKIIDYCKKHLASYEIPEHYFFLKENQWLRTSNGKVSKKLLRDYAICKLTGNEYMV